MLIGAQKAGTTSLYQYISQHPQIEFSRVKEVSFFIDPVHFARGTDYYHTFFQNNAGDAGDTVVAGCHAQMLSCADAPDRVLQYNPQMKFIVILRDPVNRAWSAFNYAKAKGWEPGDTKFPDALDLEPERLQSMEHRNRHDLVYLYNGLYWRHLTNWMKNFNKDQFLILRSRDLRDDPDGCLEQIWRFVGVEADIHCDTSREYNRASRPRLLWINEFLSSKTSRIKTALRWLLPGRLRVWIRGRVIPAVKNANEIEIDAVTMPGEYRFRLDDYFQDDLEKLATDFDIRFD